MRKGRIIMKVLCEEAVHIDFSGLDIKYSFVEYDSEGKVGYGLIAEMYSENALVGREEHFASYELSKAVKLYGILIKHKVTPVDLEYVIEDLE